MHCPGRSSDINLIVSILGLLRKRSYADGSPFESIRGLKQCVKEERVRIYCLVRYKLAYSMGKRSVAVLESRGKKTAY